MDTCPPEKQKQASGLFYLPVALSLSVSGAVTVAFAEKGLFTQFYLVLGLILVACVLALGAVYAVVHYGRRPAGK